MDNKMFVINIIKVVADVIVSTAAIIAFGWGAWFFSKWWILLFTILPMLMYYSSGIVVLGEPVEEGGGDHS